MPLRYVNVLCLCLSLTMFITLISRVLLTSVSRTLFKHAKLNNYSSKMLKFSISNALITQILIKKSYYLRSLRLCFFCLENISFLTVCFFFQQKLFSSINGYSQIRSKNVALSRTQPMTWESGGVWC